MGQWPLPAKPILALWALYVGSPTFVVTVTVPTEASTVSDAEVGVQWTFSPGTQQDLRVRVFENDGVTLKYDSGVIASAVLAHTIPAGSLDNLTTYKLRVNVTTTTGTAGESEFRTFSTSFAPSVDVTGVTAIGLGGDCAPGRFDTLPGIKVGWTEVVPGGGETFTEYRIERRLAGSSDSWVRVAEITVLGTTTYTDYCVSSRKRYEYRVLWVAFSSGDTLISTGQTPAPNALVEFDWVYFHDVTDGANFLAFPSFDWSIERAMDRRTRKSWGREAPTMFIGKLDHHRFSLTGLPGRQRRGVWEDIQALVTLERTAGVSLCMRSGVDRGRYFVNVEELDADVSQRQIEPHASIVEVHYEEDLAAVSA